MADLITLDDYKLLEGVNSTQYDEKFETLITSVSKLVRTYCNSEFDTYATSPGYTEYFDIQWDTYTVQLKYSPVISITNVYERIGQSSTYRELFTGGAGATPSYDWYLDQVSDSVFRTQESGTYRNWPHGVGSVKVIYLAGYTNIPTDLQLAVADIITYYHKDEWKERQSIGSATREGAGSSAIRNDPGFPDHIRRVLDMYRVA
jgi:hypothetical protein